MQPNAESEVKPKPKTGYDKMLSRFSLYHNSGVVI